MLRIQILILDQYSNKPNYRIGLQVTETIVSSDVDPSLTDNVKDLTNFTRPGVDRLEITASVLTKRPLDDFEDDNFVQLSQVDNGVLRSDVNKTEYNQQQERTRRTYDESGNYYIKEFTTSLKDSLNDGEGNRGIYNGSKNCH